MNASTLTRPAAGTSTFAPGPASLALGRQLVDGIEVGEERARLDRRGRVHAHAGAPVVVLERVAVTLAAAAGRVDDEGRRVEARRRAAHVLLEIDRDLHRRAQVLDALHEVVHVDVVGVHVDVNRAVRLYSALPSPSPELAATMTSLANTHFYLGHLDESEALNKRVLDLDRRSNGSRHPSVADDLLNLAAIESVRGRHGEAERYDREALDIFLAWYGPEHPETASARTILAQALMYQAKYAEARDLLRQALATQTRVYGAEHPRVAFALNELGSVAIRSNELDEAERSFGRALEIYRKVYDGKHYRVGVALVNLAGVFVARRDHARAERLFSEAVALYAEVLPADHQNVAVAQLRWGRALVQQKRHEEAERHLAEAYRMLMAQRQPPAALVLAAREDLVRVYDALGQPAKSEELGRVIAAASARP
jgi:serine/threonine-protein kinase